MKEEILKVLAESPKALSATEIEQTLEKNNPTKTNELIIALKELEDEGEVFSSKKNKYLLFDRGPYIKGVLRMNPKGFGFVEVGEGPDYFVSPDNINDSLHEDLVMIEELNEERNQDSDRKSARIIKVIKRNIDTLVGEVYSKKKNTYVTPDNPNYKFKIHIAKENAMRAVTGSKVLCKLNEKSPKGKINGQILKVIGHKDDPGVDILSVLYNKNVKVEFSPEVEEELKNLPTTVKAEEKAIRTDLTNEKIFTIDGDDTKDIDDALSIKKEEENYILTVHIADVSHYVKESSALDQEAKERGTSIYLLDRTVPMLPHQISNGICSLNENEERLAISCEMKINPQGKIIEYDIFPSVIKSKKQMTYKNVNKILEEKIVPETYEDYVEELNYMHELAHILRRKKKIKGFIDFAIDEAVVVVDEDAKPIDVVLRERGEGEKIIEDFMIEANECVANHIYYMELPFLYRVHEKPETEKIIELLSLLKTLGHDRKLIGNAVKPKFVQELIDSLKDEESFKILSSIVLRNMKKAVYSEENLGHFGIASDCYTHFTAPIRRYPDLTVHRLLKDYIFESNLSKETLNKWGAILPEIAKHSSETERTAVECEREVDSMKMAEYMEDKVGYKYDALVSGVKNFGFFAQLDNLIEGLVSNVELDGIYIYDDQSETLTSSKKNYQLGDKIKVKVLSASKERRTIDFTIDKD